MRDRSCWLLLRLPAQTIRQSPASRRRRQPLDAGSWSPAHAQSPLHVDSQVENLGQHPLVFKLREHAPNLAVEIFGFVQREAFDIDLWKRLSRDPQYVGAWRREGICFAIRWRKRTAARADFLPLIPPFGTDDADYTDVSTSAFSC